MNSDFLYLSNHSSRFFPQWNNRCGEQVTGLIQLIQFVTAYDSKIWCEIGSNIGESALIISSFKEVEKLYCIDPLWDERQYNQFLNRTKHLKHKIQLLRLKSEKAYEKFESNSIDVIYIDGGHTYNDINNDLNFAFSVVKNGGFICGHDYGKAFPDVKKAVDEFKEKYKLTNFTTFCDSSFAIKKDV